MRAAAMTVVTAFLVAGCVGNDDATPAAADPQASGADGGASSTNAEPSQGIPSTEEVAPPEQVEDTGPKSLYFEQTFALTITHAHVPSSGTSPGVAQTRVNQDPNCVGFGKDQVWLILNGTAEATWSNPGPFAQRMTVDIRDIGLMATNEGSTSPAVLEYGRFQTVPNALLGLWFIVQPTDPGVVIQQPVSLTIKFYYLGVPDVRAVVEPCVYPASFEEARFQPEVHV